MGKDIRQQELPTDPTSLAGSAERAGPRIVRGSGLVFLLVSLALILAIGFFYVSKQREDRRADQLSTAANAVDDAAKVVGDAAKNAADSFHKDDQ